MDRKLLDDLASGNNVDVQVVVQIAEELERIAGIDGGTGYAIASPLNRPPETASSQLSSAVGGHRARLGLTQR